MIARLTASRDAPRRRRPAPGAASRCGGWCKLGYRVEPRLLVVSVAMTLVAGAARSSLLGLWLAAAGRRRPATTRRAVCGRGGRARPCRPPCSWWLQVVFDRLQPALPRPAVDRDGGPRRAPPGDRRDGRAPGAPRAHRPARGAAHAARSRSTTCSCRCSRRSAGSCASPSSIVLLVTGAARARAPRGLRRSRSSSRPPGGPASSGRSTSGRRRTSAWRGTSSSWARPRRRARSCGSPASAPPGRGTGAGAWERWYRPMAAPRWGTAAWHSAGMGGLRARPTSAPIVFVATVLDASPATSCWCWPPAASSRSTSARPSASSASSAASGWTLAAAGLARGLRRRRRDADRDGAPTGSATASGSTTCRSPTRAPTAWCSTT